MQTSRKNSALALTFCGLMAALGVVIMLIGGVLGVATYAAPLLASVFLIPMQREFGKGSAALGFAVTAVLSALLCAEKELAFFYICFGYYPLVKALFDRIRSKPLRLIAKLLFFSLMTIALYAFLYFVLKPPEFMDELAEVQTWLRIAFLVSVVVILLAYDAALKVVFLFYEIRIRPKLRFL